MKNPKIPSPNVSPHSRRDFLRNTALAGAGLGMGLTRGMGQMQGPNPKKRPNILFVFSDQQSWDMMGCYGNEQIQTPNLDKFASQGVRFNHCISSSPVCTPYRGILMSGQNPLTNGSSRNGYRLLEEPGARLGEVMRDNGYRTAYVGKWHLYGAENPVPPIPDGPHRHGFEEVFLTNNCHSDFRPGHAYYFDQHTGEKHIFDVWEQRGQTEQVMDFLDTCSPEDEKPFGMVLSWHPPHNHVGMAYPAPEEFESLYSPDKIKLRPDTAGQDNAVLRGQYQGHMALCSSLDYHFGQLMAKLEERGLADNTIVVYTSDHGDMMRYREGFTWRDGPRNRYMKSRPEPTSSRVPMLIRYPGVLRPRESNLLFGAIDIMPTMLGMMQLPVPEVVEGRNLTPEIINGDDDAVDSIPMMLHAGRAWRGIYTPEHIYSFEILDGDWRTSPRYQFLVNHQKDPYVLNNRYHNDSPADKALRKKLHAQAMEWCDHFNDEGWTSFQIDEHCRINYDANPRFGVGDPGIMKGIPWKVMKDADVKGRFSTPGWADVRA